MQSDDPGIGPMALHEKRALSDLELLEIEMDLLWGTEASPELVLACARDGVGARVGERVRPELAQALAAEIHAAPPNVDSDEPPP